MSEKYFVIKIKNQQNLVNKIKQYAGRAGQLKPFLKWLDVKLRGGIEENFLTEGRYSGEKWQEWSEKYKKWRIKHYGGGQILTREGNLRESITSILEDDKLIIGTAKEYAAIHNFGHKKRNMPKREYFRFSSENLKEIKEDLRAFTLELIKIKEK